MSSVWLVPTYKLQNDKNTSLGFLSHPSGKTYFLGGLRGWHCDYRFTGDDVHGISDLKSHLHQKFQTNDMGPPTDLIRGFHFIRGSMCSICCQGCKVANYVSKLEVIAWSEELLEYQVRYRRLVGKLNCLTMTRPDAYLVSVVSQFMSATRSSH